MPSAEFTVHPLGGSDTLRTPIELHIPETGLIKNEPRTLIWREVLPGGLDAAVKVYRRSRAACMSRRGAFRARREFDAMRTIEALGLPCSSALFWAHGRFGPLGWGELIATRWLEDCIPLSQVLSGNPGVHVDLRPLMRFAATMHDAGVRHGTFLSRNILVKTCVSPPEFVLIDMPRFHHFPRSIRNTRMAAYDLMYLMDDVARFYPPETVSDWLQAYGMPESRQAKFVAALRRFKNTSRMRRIVGAEFNVRHVAARIFHALGSG